MPQNKAAGQAKTSDRERFQWEKELLGVYVGSHPVQQLNVDLSRFTTCLCAELNERHDGKNVTLAGMLASIRTTVTRKGDKMAFVQLEDMQGQCEALFFPQTYEEFKEYLEEERVVLVKGKAQTRNGRTSVLVDTLQTAVEFGLAKADAHQPAVEGGWGAAPGVEPNGSDVESMPPPDDILNGEPHMSMAEPPFDAGLPDEPAPEPGAEAATVMTADAAESETYPEPQLLSQSMVSENMAETNGAPQFAAPAQQEPAAIDPDKPEAGRCAGAGRRRRG